MTNDPGEGQSEEMAEHPRVPVRGASVGPAEWRSWCPRRRPVLGSLFGPVRMLQVSWVRAGVGRMAFRRRTVLAGVVAWLAASVGVLAVTGAPAGAVTLDVADEAGYRAALLDLSVNTTGPHVINIIGTFDITGGTDPTYSNPDWPLTINGNNHTINGGGTHRILNHSTDEALTINDLIVTNTGGGNGGAIFASGAVSVANSTFSGNNGRANGGVIFGFGAVTATSSTFTNNTATANAGAIFAGGLVTATSSTFTGNTAAANGGAILTQASLAVTDSTFSGNTAGGPASGGAISAAGAVTVTVTNSTFTDNTTNGRTGGAISAGGGTMTVTDSSFARNTATTDGGAIYLPTGSLAVANSTFTDNTTNADGGAVAVALYSDSPVTVTTSTFTGNTAATGRGGGLYTPRGLMTVTNSTFNANTAGEFGGGLAAQNWPLGMVHATVVDNGAPLGANVQAAALDSFGSVVAGPLDGGANCSINGSEESSYSYSDDGSCGFLGTGDTQNGLDPQLEALGDYGGPTYTRPPQVISPLVDAIPVAHCHPTVVVDQRGEPRPAGGGCDIGAVEPDYVVADDTDPTIEVAAPLDGAAYPLGQQVTADYSCADEAGGSGIETCAGTVADGQPIDTSTLGPHVFTVAATDLAGNEATVTHTYTVAVARPDARIGEGVAGPLVGDDIYNNNGRGQTVSGSAARGDTVLYTVSVQNDAPFADTLRLRGQDSTRAFTVRYTAAGTDITNQVTAGTYTTPSLAPGDTHTIEVLVTVTANANRNSTQARSFTATSTTDTTRKDTVKFVTSRA